MKTQRGMTLIEVMVAMLIGLIGCIAIFQMYSVADTRKRTVSSGSDMDIAGRLALMTLERDLQLAGYGYGMAAASTASLGGPMMGCAVVAYDNQRPVAVQDFSFPFVPVVITQGAAGAPDSIAVLKGSSDLLVIGKVVDNGSATTVRVKADTGGRTGVRKGDVVIEAYRTATPAPGIHECGMFEIVDDTDADQLTFKHEPSTEYTTALGVTKSTRYNKAGGTTFALTMGEGKLYNLGPSPARSIWSVLPPGAGQSGKLVVTNDLAWTDMNSDNQNDLLEAADLVVNLQAQYGVDTNADGMVDSWVDSMPTNDWTTLLAVRFALLTRSQQLERLKIYELTGANSAPFKPSWSGGTFTMTNIDGTPDNEPGGINDWRFYRYKVFETVVPLRNTIVGKAVT
jgi:type IV pilus assembly protein PilW